jgi:hypothetical protein
MNKILLYYNIDLRLFLSVIFSYFVQSVITKLPAQSSLNTFITMTNSLIGMVYASVFNVL